MTNWCENLLEVEGDKESIAAFRAQCFGSDGLFHLELVLPVPPEVSRVHDNRHGKLGSDGELGVAAILKSEDALPFSRVRPILERQAVKEAGIDSYEVLEQWLRKNNPKALELGNQAVIAHSKTGSCFADDWTTANWGTSWYMNSGLRMESETRVEITFATAWSMADKIFHELARRFPNLAIRAKAEEQGNAFAYRFVSNSGVVTEEELPWSREFVATMGIQLDEDGDEVFEDDDGQINVKALPSERLTSDNPSTRPKGEMQSHGILRSVSLFILMAILAVVCAIVGSALWR